MVHNQNGVLNRLMGLLTKHQYKLISLAVVVYNEVKDISKVSVIVEAEDDHKFLQLVKLINKQIDVLSITDLTDEHVIDRELLSMKKLLT